MSRQRRYSAAELEAEIAAHDRIVKSHAVREQRLKSSQVMRELIAMRTPEMAELIEQRKGMARA